MNQINIIDKIQLTDKGLVVRGTKQEAHLRQGQLDGACAVYSMMMCLIIEKIIRRSQVTNVTKELKRNTADGRLVRHFLENRGMIIGGYVFQKLRDELQTAFSKKVIPHYYDIDEVDDLIKEMFTCLNDNHPIEIGFDYKGGKSGHAVVAIGYQSALNSITLYCLDPSYPMEQGQLWNNTLEIVQTSRAKYNCYNLRDNTHTFVDGFLMFEKR